MLAAGAPNAYSDVVAIVTNEVRQPVFNKIANLLIHLRAKSFIG